MARQKKLKPLADYLRPPRRNPRRAEGDGSDEVAAFLDRKIDRQARAAAAPRTDR